MNRQATSFAGILDVPAAAPPDATPAPQANNFDKYDDCHIINALHAEESLPPQKFQKRNRGRTFDHRKLYKKTRRRVFCLERNLLYLME